MIAGVSVTTLLLVLVAGIGAGFVGYAVGASSLISYPALLAFGIPPVLSNTTNTVGVVGTGIGGLLAARKELNGQRTRVIVYALIGLVGGIIGGLLLLELPAGKLEAGEDPFEAAKRELSEECGLTADNFIDLGVVYATVGYDSEKIYLWAATGLHEVKQHLDAGEFLDVVKMPFDKALGLVMDGTIKDSKTQVALLKYAQLRDKA